MESVETPLHTSHFGRTLVIMAKAPRPGSVKTRLSPYIDAEAVTQLYRCLLSDTLTLAHSLAGVHVAIMCPESDVAELSDLAGDKTKVVAQEGKGLAAGLNSVFARFTRAGREHVIAFNSDSPHLPPSVLASAFDTLVTHDLVVGPTYDGGYYLVGAKTPHLALFDGDGMGTNSALDTLLTRAKSLNLSIDFTDTFYDIDVEGDLSRLAAELQLSPLRAPRTAAWLQQRQAPAARSQSALGNL